jgi:hypothetical protein
MNTTVKVALAFVIIFVCSTFFACQKKQDEESPGEKSSASKPSVYAPEMSDFKHFNASDAATILDVPVDQITAKSEEGYEGFWQCTFTTDDYNKSVSFSVSIAKSVAQAVTDMEQYRSNLEFAGSTKVFENNSASGAYSDIIGVGDDAVWTAINGTLSVRKGNVTLQIIMPSDRLKQIEVAKTFIDKL